MNQGQADKTFPILVGGAVLGVLSAVPIINFVNCACCAWVIFGGALASYLYLKNYPPTLQPPTYGDGAIIGVLAGIVGAVIDTIISLPLHFLTQGMIGDSWREQIEEALSDPEIPEGVRQLIESLLAGGLGLGAVLLELVFSLVIFAIFGAIGGIIGIAMFQKKAPPSYPTYGYQAPPAPQQGPPTMPQGPPPEMPQAPPTDQVE